MVGDVHGCFAELQRLLAEVGFGSEDLLVSVGDLLDRGPEPWEAATFFRETPNAAWVLGNHERRVARFVRGTSPAAWSQRQCLAKLPSIEHEPWASFLEALPAVVETPHAIVTHGRLDPTKPLDAQDPHHTAAVGGAGAKIPLDSFGVPLWFREMDGLLPPGKPVCFGHLGYARVELVERRLFALDTGACAGKELTAVVLPEGRVVSVTARCDHAANSWKEWQGAMSRRAGRASRGSGGEAPYGPEG